MKVLFYMEQPGLGGTDTVLANIFNNWPAADDEIIYMTTIDNQGIKLLKNILNKSNVKLHLIAFKFKPNIKYFGSKLIDKLIHNILSLTTFFTRTVTFYFILRKIKPDMLISNNGGYPGAYSCQSMVMAAKLAHIKRIFLVVHHLPVSKRRQFLLFEILMDFFVKCCVNNFITVSKASKCALHNKRRFPLHKIKVIYNGLDFYIPSPKIDLRSRYCINKGKKIIGCVANLFPHKGHKVLIRAYNRTAIKNDSVLLIIGKKIEPIYSDCFALAKELQLENRVVFCGFLEDHPVAIIKQLDLLVLPTLDFEGFGMVIMEAMVSQVPVITTSVGAIPEIVKNKEHCILVEPGDDYKLAFAIDDIFKHQIDTQEMVKRARIHFERNYLASTMAQKYRELNFL